MPSAKLTKTFISNLGSHSATTDYFDSEVKGLILRVSKTGVISYRLKYYINKKQKIYTIAKHGAITLLQAKKEGQRLLGLIAQGIDIQEYKKQTVKQAKQDSTFEYLLEEFGYAWYKQNNKCWKRDIQQLKNTYGELLSKPISEINNKLYMQKFLENRRITNNWKNNTYNRNLERIKGVFSRFLENEYIKENNIKNIKKLKVTTQKVRYLSEDETERFFEALENQTELAKNIILVAYYTGMRKSEILTLCWDDIDVDTNQIVLKPHNTKANRPRYVPINSKIRNILAPSPKSKGLIFLNLQGTQVTQIEKQWRKLKKEARIENFRFHDLRHNFCSMLVMKGVPIYTVCQLAGHADVKTTQIYAHLSPDVRRSAIDLL